MSRIEKITGYMIMKKSSFIVWWLVIELLVELLKACLPKQNKTKQNQKIITAPPPPPPHPSGYKPTSRFSCLGSGADVSLVTLSVNGNERKTCRGIRKSWPPTLTCPVLRLSPVHWLRVSKRFLFWRKFVRSTYPRTIMKMTTISPF